jgi:hypothetical protein
MSNATLHRQPTKSRQLCFAWMQTERTSPSVGKPTKKNLGTGRQHNLTSDRSSLPANANSLLQPINRSQRVGQARLGTVMLALLKRYGITEQEIEAELAAIRGQA